MSTTPEKKIEDFEPVLIVTNKGYLIQAGHPKCLTKKLAQEYAQAGYSMKTITIQQFRSKTWKWIYDKH